VGNVGRCLRLTSLPSSCAVVMNSGNHNFLETSGPLQAYNGTALPLPLTLPLHVSSTVHKTHNSALLRYPNNSKSRLENNVLILRNVAWYSFAVAGACYVFKQTYILTANVKFAPCQHTNTGRADKSLARSGRR